MSDYGPEFDRLAAEWRTIENAHDREHPDRGECGGVGGCTAMRIAVRLEHRMVDALDEWRRRPTPPSVCPVHRIPGAGREPIAVPIPGCRNCAGWLAGAPLDDTVEQDRRAVVLRCAAAVDDGVNYAAEARDLAQDVVDAFGAQYGHRIARTDPAPNETGSPDAP